MPDLRTLLQQCEADTLRLLGPVAAHRLANWRRHAAKSEADLIIFIQTLLWGEHCENGYRLDQQQKLSLERIVLDHCPNLFTQADLDQAKRTLHII
ncbi:MAG: hypothetical protein L0387_28830 [Acidobacteria bacterium]|nr:hypothetical protein [Acidobacteriota bacterium]